MGNYGYSDMEEKEHVKKHSENSITEESVRKNLTYHYSVKPTYQDYYIPYTTNANLSGNTNVIQCFPEESRTLTWEAKAIRDAVRKRVNSLELEMSDFDISSQFDDDYYDMYVESRKLQALHETLHHILPRNAIDKFIGNLNKEQKRQILLTFIRYTEGDRNDVSMEEYAKIQNGTDDGLVEHMLGRTLKSLRSNLIFGPAKRSDDPKGKIYDLDPNFIPGSGGKIDEISSCYKEAYDKINALQDLKVENPLEYDRCVAEIVEKLKEAETLLAKAQGISGADAYLHTRLEMGKSENWILNDEVRKPFKKR